MFPREHLNELKKRACEQARRCGHQLGRWEQDEFWPWLHRTRCVVCGADAQIESKSIDGDKLIRQLEALRRAAVSNGSAENDQSRAEKYLSRETSVWGTALTCRCPVPDNGRGPGRDLFEELGD